MNEIRWERRGLIQVPVVDEPERELCRVCGCVSPVGLCRPCRDSSRERVHGSHAGFNQHKRRMERPCVECVAAERLYQGKRYRRGQLSDVDRAWAEKNAVKSSWELDTRLNRSVRVVNTT